MPKDCPRIAKGLPRKIAKGLHNDCKATRQSNQNLPKGLPKFEKKLQKAQGLQSHKAKQPKFPSPRNAKIHVQVYADLELYLLKNNGSIEINDILTNQ